MLGLLQMFKCRGQILEFQKGHAKSVFQPLEQICLHAHETCHPLIMTALNEPGMGSHINNVTGGGNVSKIGLCS